MKTRLISVAMIIALGVSTLQARGDDDYRHNDYRPNSMLQTRGDDDRHHNDNRHEFRNHGANWVIPLVVGGVIGYTFSRPEQERVVVYSQPRYHEEWVYMRDCDCKRRVMVEER
jgi:hypothetical protein